MSGIRGKDKQLIICECACRNRRHTVLGGFSLSESRKECIECNENMGSKNLHRRRRGLCRVLPGEIIDYSLSRRRTSAPTLARVCMAHTFAAHPAP